MIIKLLTEHHLKFLSLRGGCRGSSESTLVKMSNCWKSHATAHIQSVPAYRSTGMELRVFYPLRFNAITGSSSALHFVAHSSNLRILR